ncbi:MAG: hypothetical protein HQ546_00740 [Planctomycetes bacterium]|nr:hypothetical protein [Planctomycetota bacterium]
MAGQTPLAKFRAGQMASAVWANDTEVKGQTVTILKATVQRRYKDKDGNWQSSGSFSRNEIPLAVFCLQKAFDKIVEMQNTASAGNNNNVDEISILD